MKVVLALVCLAVAVMGETCDHDSDCHLIDCGGGFNKECYQHDPTAIKTCTCVPDMNEYKCQGTTDCVDMYGFCHYGRMRCLGHSKPHCRCYKDD